MNLFLAGVISGGYWYLWVRIFHTVALYAPVQPWVIRIFRRESFWWATSLLLWAATTVVGKPEQRLALSLSLAAGCLLAHYVMRPLLIAAVIYLVKRLVEIENRPKE